MEHSVHNIQYYGVPTTHGGGRDDDDDRHHYSTSAQHTDALRACTVRAGRRVYGPTAPPRLAPPTTPLPISSQAVLAVLARTHARATTHDYEHTERRVTAALFTGVSYVSQRQHTAQSRRTRHVAHFRRALNPS